MSTHEKTLIAFMLARLPGHPLPGRLLGAAWRRVCVRLVQVAARHAALPEDERPDHDADMRFFSLSKSGFPSIDATLDALERQRSSK
ncbi:MAG: hypothetical protein Q8O00_15830 [Holophaga sp.]|nr:hypothetical protein [Holophaga sp.]